MMTNSTAASMEETEDNLDSPDQKLRTWQVWCDPTGKETLVWGRLRPWPWEGLALVQEFQSANWLTAEYEAFKRRSPIDRKMRQLIALLNELPGVMTTGCCQGHRRRSESFAYVGLHFDNLDRLEDFATLLEDVTGAGVPLEMTLRLCWGGRLNISQEMIPAGALSFALRLTRKKQRGKQRPPRRCELNAFTAFLREKAYEASLLSRPDTDDFGRIFLPPSRQWQRAKRQTY